MCQADSVRRLENGRLPAPRERRPQRDRGRHGGARPSGPGSSARSPRRHPGVSRRARRTPRPSRSARVSRGHTPARSGRQGLASVRGIGGRTPPPRPARPRWRLATARTWNSDARSQVSPSSSLKAMASWADGDHLIDATGIGVGRDEQDPRRNEPRTGIAIVSARLSDSWHTDGIVPAAIEVGRDPEDLQRPHDDVRVAEWLGRSRAPPPPSVRAGRAGPLAATRATPKPRAMCRATDRDPESSRAGRQAPCEHRRRALARPSRSRGPGRSPLPAAASPGSDRQKSRAVQRLARSALIRSNASTCRASFAPAMDASSRIQSRWRRWKVVSPPASRSRSRPNWRSGSRSRNRSAASPCRRLSTDFSTSDPTSSGISSASSPSPAQTAWAASSSNPPANTDRRAHSSRSCSLRSW